MRSCDPNPDRPTEEPAMNRPANRTNIFVRALAAAFAIGITSLIVGVHAADLSTLGGHEVTTAANWPDASSGHVASAR
jgi:hypothetical protein